MNCGKVSAVALILLLAYQAGLWRAGCRENSPIQVETGGFQNSQPSTDTHSVPREADASQGGINGIDNKDQMSFKVDSKDAR